MNAAFKRVVWIMGLFVLMAGALPGCFFSSAPAPPDERLASAEAWVAAGVAANAAGVKPDLEILADYYRSAEELGLLRLFCTRFDESLNTAGELEIAAWTAQSLARYIEETKGFDALFEPIEDADKTGWLRRIGVERVYADPYEGYLDRYTVTGFDPLVVHCDDALYILEPYAGSLPSLGFDTAARMETFLYREAHGKEYILDWLRANAGAEISRLLPLDSQVTYRNNPRAARSETRRGAVYKSITLHNPSPHLHEYIHLITGRSYLWARKGIAEYLSALVYPMSYEADLNDEYGLGRFLADAQTEDRYGPFIRERYARYTGREAEAPFDVRALFDAVSAALASDEEGLLRQDNVFRLRPLPEVYPEDLIVGQRVSPGDMMSSLEAASFIAFLTDTYAFETVIQMIGD
ncbi:MAG: hypothetical protein FWG93_08880, partial [Oscillospiraceae bacterium]|nr:hypothetical protein [Oscillospiraceae bacterium]